MVFYHGRLGANTFSICSCAEALADVVQINEERRQARAVNETRTGSRSAGAKIPVELEELTFLPVAIVARPVSDDMKQKRVLVSNDLTSFQLSPFAMQESLGRWSARNVKEPTTLRRHSADTYWTYTALTVLCLSKSFRQGATIFWISDGTSDWGHMH